MKADATGNAITKCRRFLRDQIAVLAAAFLIRVLQRLPHAEYFCVSPARVYWLGDEADPWAVQIPK